MASLKFLAALKVSENTGISELDNYVSDVRSFVCGDSQKVPPGILDYHTYSMCVLGNKFFTNSDNTFFLNKKHLLDGPSDTWDRGALVSRIWYKNGERHGVETKWWCPKTKRTECRWKEGKRVGDHKKWNRSGWLSEVETYSEQGILEWFTVYSLSQENKVAYSMRVPQFE
nr:putative MORN repeat-containing protein [Marseillevirus cajuinensis]